MAADKMRAASGNESFQIPHHAALDAGSICATSPRIRAMGVHRTIRSAPSTARCKSSVARLTAPSASDSTTLAGRRTKPTTEPAILRFLRAIPNEPPSRPTPTNVIFFQYTG